MANCKNVATESNLLILGYHLSKRFSNNQVNDQHVRQCIILTSWFCIYFNVIYGWLLNKAAINQNLWGSRWCQFWLFVEKNIYKDTYFHGKINIMSVSCLKSARISMWTNSTGNPQHLLRREHLTWNRNSLTKRNPYGKSLKSEPLLLMQSELLTFVGFHAKYVDVLVLTQLKAPSEIIIPKLN